MSTTPAAAPNGGAPRPQKQQPNKSNGVKKEVKILMLHGFTQSGALFHIKTRALEKLLTKTLAPLGLLPMLIYPTGPHRLLASDSPGYQPPPEPQHGTAAAEDHQPDTWSWFRKDEAASTYHLIPGMAAIARTIRDAGGIDAVCGFSQGAAMTGFVAAALEPERPVPDGPDGGDWASELREANGGRPVKFAVAYSGYYAAVERLQWLYEPKIKTPTLHYIGSLDTVVEESRSQALVERCEDPVVVVHPGGHHVPVAKEWAMPLALFIKNHAKDEGPSVAL